MATGADKPGYRIVTDDNYAECNRYVEQEI